MLIRSHGAIAMTALAGVLLAGNSLSLTAEAQPSAYAGPAVTVVKARKACFADTIAVTGTIAAREEALVRPEREGLQISLVLVEPGDIVSSGQVLARLLPPGAPSGTAPTPVQAPVGGIVNKVSATVGTYASAKADPLFQIIARGEFELMAELSVRYLSRLSPGQTAKVNIVGIGEVAGQVRLVSTNINAMSQLGQVRVFLGANPSLRVGTFGRAIIIAGQSCGVGIPLSAVLYSADGAVVAVVRNQQIETRQVRIGLLSEGEAEISRGADRG